MNFFLQIILFFLTWSVTIEAQSFKCAVQAQSAILYNPDKGMVLFEKDPYKPHYPASILKIATALFVLEGKKVDLDTPYTVSNTAIQKIDARIRQQDPLSYPPYILEHDGIEMGLEKGESYSLNTLLHGLLLLSANDPANVIAENCSGNVETFVEELNLFLERRGIRETTFQNPHGFYHPAQLTTAYDMAKIAAMAFNHPTFSKIIRTITYEDPETGRIIRNTNQLLKEGKFHYPKILGGKTGYTASSGFNLVAAAENEGRKLIVVLLGCPSREDCFKDAITLFEMAFREKKKERLLFSKEHECFSKKLEKGKELKAKLTQDVIYSYYPSEERPLKSHLVWDEFNLPIHSGSEVGKILIEDEKGQFYASAPLVAKQTINKPQRYQWIFFVGVSIFLYFLKRLKKSRKVLKR